MYDARLRERRESASRKHTETDSQRLHPPSHWGCGAKDFALHPRLIQESLSAGGRLPPDREVFDAQEFSVSALSEGDEQLLGANVVLDPCGLKGRNVCSRSPRHMELSRIHAALCLLTDRVGRDAARSGDLLIMCEGSGAPLGSSRVRLFCLMSMVSFSPKYQDYSMVIPADPTIDLSQVHLPLPLPVDVAFAPLRLSGVPSGDVVEGIAHRTSDGLAQVLAGTARFWRFRVCVYDLVNPVRMIITSTDERPEICLDVDSEGPGARRRPAPPTPADRELALQLAEIASLSSMGDPRRPARPRQQPPKSGRASATQPASASRQPPAEPLPPGVLLTDAFPPSGDAEEDLSGDDDIGDGLGPGALVAPLPGLPGVDGDLMSLGAGILIHAADPGDLLDEDGIWLATEPELPPPFVSRAEAGDPLAAASAASGRVAGSGTSAGVGEGIDHAAEVLDMAAELAGIMQEDPTALPGAGAVSASEGGSDGPVSVEPGAASAEQPAPPVEPLARRSAELGSAVAGAPPGWTMTSRGYCFDPSGEYRGRITAWKTSVSCKCRLHGCSKAKNRSRITDGQLMQWLAEGLEQCMPSPECSVQDMAKRHLRLFPL